MGPYMAGSERAIVHRRIPHAHEALSTGRMRAKITVGITIVECGTGKEAAASAVTQQIDTVNKTSHQHEIYEGTEASDNIVPQKSTHFRDK